jgi:hypothetical protein
MSSRLPCRLKCLSPTRYLFAHGDFGMGSSDSFALERPAVPYPFVLDHSSLVCRRRGKPRLYAGFFSILHGRVEDEMRETVIDQAVNDQAVNFQRGSRRIRVISSRSIFAAAVRISV